MYIEVNINSKKSGVIVKTYKFDNAACFFNNQIAGRFDVYQEVNNTIIEYDTKKYALNVTVL